MAAGTRRIAAPLLLSFLLIAAPAGAATITVDTETDTVSADGLCSLREAVTAANNNAGTGGCAAGDGADTVALPAGVFELSIPGAADNANAAGDLDALSNIALSGAGAGKTVIKATNSDRILQVGTGRTVTIAGLTMTGGRAPNGGNGPAANGAAGGPGAAGSSGTAGSGGVGGDGGSILNAGTLTLTDVGIKNSAAGDGGAGGTGTGGAGGTNGAGGAGFGGFGGAGGSGGAIANSGTLTVQRSTITGSHAGRGGHGGAGVGGPGGPGTANNAGGAGGAAFGGFGGVGGSGGAIATVNAAPGPGVANVSDSTIRDNRSGDSSGAGDGVGGVGGTGAGTGAGGAGGSGFGGFGGAGGGGGGAGITPPTGTLTVSRSTVAGNRTGDGSDGGAGVGGPGGQDGAGAGGAGGAGAAGFGGFGGPGGQAGGLRTATATNVTVDSNQTGTGGDGGTGSGGHGGPSTGSTGGAGGAGFGGFGSVGGAGGGATDTTFVHGTIVDNHTGAGGELATGIPGTVGPGSASGATGTGFPGVAGAKGDGAAMFGGSLKNSIVSSVQDPACGGSPTANGGNIDFPDSTCPGANLDPKLGSLDDNGGPAPTRSLGAGSGARDHVAANAACAGVDERGLARPQGPACDTGAFEAANPSATTGAASDVGTSAATLNGTAATKLRATTYYFRFGKTDSYGSRTATGEAGGATAPSAVASALTGLEPATTYHYRLVVTNEDGRAVGNDATFTTAALPPGDSPPPPPPPPPADTTAPVFVAVSATGKRVKYALSEAARVALTIRRASAGRKVGKRCKKPTKANRARRKCTRFVKVKGFSQTAVAGANQATIPGKKLRPGKYRVVLVATDAAGNKSAPKRVSFRVKR